MKCSLIVFIAFGALLAVTLLPQSATSLKCYICNSMVEKQGCGHGKDVSQEYLKDCNDQPPEQGAIVGAKYDFCRKIVTVIEFDVNNNTANERIVRKCGHLPSKYDEECYYRGGFGGRQRVCSCKEDGCNSGFTFGVNYILMGVAVLATFVTMRS